VHDIRNESGILRIELSISLHRFTEYKLRVSELLQLRDWRGLLRLCNVEDSSEKKTIALIVSNHDSKIVAKFVKYVLSLPRDEKRELREGVATTCLILGRTGQDSIEKAISNLRGLLLEDRMLLPEVEAALSNFWVLRTKATSSLLFKSWILKTSDTNDLQIAAVRSCQYLLEKEPRLVAPFLLRVERLALRSEKYDPAVQTARELIVRLSTKKAQKGRFQTRNRIIGRKKESTSK
jgi:hypothetical protein